MESVATRRGKKRLHALREPREPLLHPRLDLVAERLIPLGSHHLGLHGDPTGLPLEAQRDRDGGWLRIDTVGDRNRDGS